MDETKATAGAGADSDSSGRFARAKDIAAEGYGKASDAVRDGYNTIREKVEDVDFGAITDQVRSYVRSNPGKALMISLGVGFVVGMLLRRSDRDDEE